MGLNMYHPYFRGKQYELITIREVAPILAASKFVPIIEPVREALNGLERSLKEVCDAKGRAVVIPRVFLISIWAQLPTRQFQR